MDHISDYDPTIMQLHKKCNPNSVSENYTVYSSLSDAVRSLLESFVQLLTLDFIRAIKMIRRKKKSMRNRSLECGLACRRLDGDMIDQGLSYKNWGRRTGV